MSLTGECRQLVDYDHDQTQAQAQAQRVTGMGVCSRVCPAGWAQRRSTTATSSSSNSAISTVDSHANRATQRPTETWFHAAFGSTADTVTRPSRIGAASAHSVDHSTEPLLDPETPPTKTCVPGSGSGHGAPSSRRHF